MMAAGGSAVGSVAEAASQLLRSVVFTHVNIGKNDGLIVARLDVITHYPPSALYAFSCVG